MPPLYTLNTPPNPFWTFVQDLDDHPFFAAYAPHARAQQEQQQGTSQPQQGPASENARGKQPAADDPPEVDPSTVRPEHQHESRDMPFRGRDGHHGPPHEGRRGPGCRGRGGWGGRGRGGFEGPPPFAFGPGFWGGPRHHPHHHHHGHHRRGPSHERERRSQSPEHNAPGFNLGEFLNNLGDRLGIDLAGAAENLGLDKFSAPRSNEEVDFEPRTDIFDTPSTYIIHASLPGAKKGDLAVDWDGEHSVLRITGVVHRPGVDEELLKQLIVNGRKRENGVFEKAIRLGTKRDPANVDIAGISAKMVDGVLVVKVPKVDREVQKREVPISGSASPQPTTNEKDLLFDADEEMYDAAPEQETQDTSAPAATKDKEQEARDDRSVTAGREEEPLPRYQADKAEPNEKDMSDWERESEEEGDYVKINVD